MERCNLHDEVGVIIDVHNPPDLSVIDEVIAGNESAYEVLVDRYKDFVYTLVVRVLRNAEDAEEAAQDAFIKAYQSLKNFERKSKFSTWLYRIAFNTAVTYKRRRKIEVSHLDDMVKDFAKTADGTGAAQKVQNADRRRFIERALARLNSADAAVLTLFYLKELSLDEISGITGGSINTVKVRLFRARKRLADELRDELAEEAEVMIES